MVILFIDNIIIHMMLQNKVFECDTIYIKDCKMVPILNSGSLTEKQRMVIDNLLG